MKIGYDLYCIDGAELLSLLKYVKSKKLRIFHLRKYDNSYRFYASSLQSYLWRHCDIPMEYIGTIGLIKYFLYFKGLQSLLIIVGFVSGIILFSHIIFNVNIIGSIPSLNKDMHIFLSENNINCFSFKKDYEELNDLLIKMKDKYKNNIEYINLYQKGETFFVEYTNKKRLDIEQLDFQNIYALKDGMIESFDIESGNIKVKRLDYVKKGDLLVENTLIATDDTVQLIPVKGNVYAYTFNQYEASVKNTNQDYIDTFYYLLLSIRSKLPADAIIDKENVLQIEKTRSTITLRMHYTLLENIAQKKEN